jgi:bifunctional non-homologous end joining protein LigD
MSPGASVKIHLMPVLPKTPPIRPILRSRAFDHADYLFELKYDGFRAMVYLQAGNVEILSRNRHVFAEFKELRVWLGENLRVIDAILDGEICCLDDAGKPQFNDLTTGIRPPYFVAFDLLWLNGEDLRSLPLIERKKRLAAIVPNAPAFLLYVDHIEARGTELFAAICAQDLEGMVAKPTESQYDPDRTKWFKIKNPNYSQREGRREMFNSFMGYNDIAHVRELSREVVWTPSSNGGTTDRQLWYRAAKTGVAYQESFVLREPVVVEKRGVVPIAAANQRSPRRQTKLTLPRSTQAFTHPELVLWPNEGITKGDLIRYYDAVSRFMLPHIEGRILMLERHPNGVGGKWFLQKDTLPEETPEWIKTSNIWSPSRDEGSRYISYHVGADRDHLLHFAQLCTTTLHTWATTADSPDCADTLILDLDPFNAPFATVQQVALTAKAVLDELQLRSYIKTSGATGLHIFVPLLANRFTHDQVRLVAAAIAKMVVDRRPDIATVERLVRDRNSKVYVDFGQNGRGRTVASVYSPRACRTAPVSTPLKWAELDEPIDPLAFSIRTVFERLERVGDLWAKMWKHRQDIGPLCAALLHKRSSV